MDSLFLYCDFHCIKVIIIGLNLFPIQSSSSILLLIHKYMTQEMKADDKSQEDVYDITRLKKIR